MEEVRTGGIPDPSSPEETSVCWVKEHMHAPDHLPVCVIVIGLGGIHTKLIRVVLNTNIIEALSKVIAK